MKKKLLISFFVTALIVSTASILPASGTRQDFSPKQDEPIRQGRRAGPRAMHSAMKELPGITIGKENADLIGNDNRVLQAAVDYIAGLGGGIVEIKIERIHLGKHWFVCLCMGE